MLPRQDLDFRSEKFFFSGAALDAHILVIWPRAVGIAPEVKRFFHKIPPPAVIRPLHFFGCRTAFFGGFRARLWANTIFTEMPVSDSFERGKWQQSRDSSSSRACADFSERGASTLHFRYTFLGLDRAEPED